MFYFWRRPTDREILIEIHRMLGDLMADLTGINAALTDLSAQITQLAEQVAALSAETVTQEELDAVAKGISDAAASVDAIITTDDTP